MDKGKLFGAIVVMTIGAMMVFYNMFFFSAEMLGTLCPKDEVTAINEENRYIGFPFNMIDDSDPERSICAYSDSGLNFFSFLLNASISMAILGSGGIFLINSVVSLTARDPDYQRLKEIRLEDADIIAEEEE